MILHCLLQRKLYLCLTSYNHLVVTSLFQKVAMNNLLFLCSASVIPPNCLPNPPFGTPYSWTINTLLLPMPDAELMISAFRERKPWWFGSVVFPLVPVGLVPSPCFCLELLLWSRRSHDLHDLASQLQVFTVKPSSQCSWCVPYSDTSKWRNPQVTSKRLWHLISYN